MLKYNLSLGQEGHLGTQAVGDSVPDQELAYLGCLATAGVWKYNPFISPTRALYRANKQ